MHTSRTHTRYSLHALFALTLPLLLAPFARAQTSEILVATGDAVPGGNGEFLGVYRGPDDNISGPRGAAVLNNSGEVGFAAYLRKTAGGTTDDSGVYLWTPDGIVEILREGEVPPDGDGIFNRQPNFNNPALLDDGRVAYSSQIRESDSGDFFETAAYYDDLASEPRQLARSNDPAPFGDVFDAIFGPRINGAGQVAFLAEVDDDTNPLGDRAMYRAEGASGELTLIVRENDATPDGTASYDLISGPAFNGAGQVAFSSSLNSSVFDDRGVFRGDGETVVEIARKGDPVPESSNETVESLAGGAYFDMDESGRVVFWADFTDTHGQGLSSGTGYLLGDGTSLQLVARTGQPAPDGNGVFSSFYNLGTGQRSPDLNERGQISFWAALSGASNNAETGIFRSEGPGAGITQIARRNDITPDGEYVFGFIYRLVETIKRAGEPWLNDAGQVAFYTNVHPIDGGPGVQGGIYFWDEALGLFEVAQTGKPMMGGTLSRVSLLGRNGYSARSTRSGFNDRGQIVYVFVLEDGREGIALWTPPEIFADARGRKRP